MKIFYAFIILFVCFFTQYSFAQDSAASINTTWAFLKTQLQKRADLIVNLTNNLTQSKKINKQEIAKSKKLSGELSKYLDTLKQLNSISIKIASEKNSELNISFKKLLVALENDPKIKKQKDFNDFLSKLENADNRVAVGKYDYNDTCKKYNSMDLQFISNEEAKDIRVEF